ncbi:MAG TPA: hypothetical protein VF473_00085 [Cyclobacteriaceae bacterium]
MKRKLLFSVLVLCVSCSRPVPELSGFDKVVWKNDPKGCNGERVQYLKGLNEQRDKLKGLSEADLVTLLGNPDKRELSEHHEKFYSYFIEPSVDCGKGDSSTTVLEVRFNATGVSKEVSIIAID